jgi:hypothetical protein
MRENTEQFRSFAVRSLSAAMTVVTDRVTPEHRSGTAVRSQDSLRYLLPEEYPLWDALVDVSPQGTVLCRSWCLRALSEYQGSGILPGRPFGSGYTYHEFRFCLRICCMPKLVHSWWVTIEPGESKRITANTREMEILDVFAQRLKKERCFIQSFHPTLSNWLPFYWNGFTQMTRFSCILNDISDEDKVWDQSSPEHTKSGKDWNTNCPL